MSIALFSIMNALASAEAQLHEKEMILESETCIVSVLVHAVRVAHAACEAALTRVEPMYDADFNSNAAEYCLCKTEVATALENAKTIVSALEYASTRHMLSVDMCGDVAMRAAIDAENIGAVALGVVLLSKIATLPPRDLLYYALNQKKLDIHVFRMLLSSPAVVSNYEDSKYNNKNTALMMIASRNGHAEAVVALLERPGGAASACTPNTDANTALMVASDRRHTRTVAALLTCPQVSMAANATSKCGNTALMLASKHGDTEMINTLLSCPQVAMSANASNIVGYTALTIAASYGHAESVTALLACSAVVASACAVNNFGYTALMTLSHHGQALGIRTLLLACPEVASTAGFADPHGNTALMIAATTNYDEVIAVLLECSAVLATMSVVNKDGNTALKIARRWKHEKTILLLEQIKD
jgi:uncharacterized protein